MKKTNFLLVCLVTLITSSIQLSSCGRSQRSGCVNENGSVGKNQGSISDVLKIESEGYDDNYGVMYYANLKNISNQTLDGGFQVKVQLKDGTTETNTCDVKNMSPGDIQKVAIYIGNSEHTYNVTSWSFGGWTY